MHITLLEFSAPWCSACKALAPVLDAAAAPYTLTRRKIDTEADPATAAYYGIRALPTLLFLRGNDVVAQLVGNVPRSKLDAVLQQLAPAPQNASTPPTCP